LILRNTWFKLKLLSISSFWKFEFIIRIRIFIADTSVDYLIPGKIDLPKSWVVT